MPAVAVGRCHRELAVADRCRLGAAQPDGYMLDIALMARPGSEEIQLYLIKDYRTIPVLYPAFQAYFREHQLPFLAVWGRHDPAFLPAGAEAYKRDLPSGHVHLLDAGHFAIETHADEVAQFIRSFLQDVMRA